MSFLVPVALFGWPLLMILVFGNLRSRRAIIGSFVAGWLFLPVATYHLEGVPEYTKITAVGLGLLPAILLFDSGRLRAFRPSWGDLPIALWCVSPFFSSVANDLGVYDGMSAAFAKTVTWGVPYFLGRLYIQGADGLRDLATAIFMGGIVYIPLCLLEIRLSPQLHTWVYGFHPHSFLQTVRFGGWRPVVFMQHGLAVGMWMAMASLVGVWLWTAGTLRRLWGLHIGWWVGALIVTTVLCKSSGSLVLLAAGTCVLFMIRWRRSSWPLVFLLVPPLAYLSVRATGIWSGREAVELASRVSADRAESLDYRLKSENVLVQHALRRPVFGWGAWGRNRPEANEENPGSIATDGLWVIAVGSQGMVGLISLIGYFLVPAIGFMRRIPGSAWFHPRIAGGAVLAVVMLLHLSDNMMNALSNPVYGLAAGGLISALTGLRRQRGSAALPADSGRAPALLPMNPGNLSTPGGSE